MIKFEKVSFDQFKKDVRSIMGVLDDDLIQKAYDNIMLPQRSDVGSAGYDFYSPFDFEVNPHVTVVTGIKVIMPENVALLLFPRSGMGFKTGVRLANTIGLIDSSYYNNEVNEGHIMAKYTRGFKHFTAKAGDRVLQGIFVNVLFADEETVRDTKRRGGFGSTGK